MRAQTNEEFRREVHAVGSRPAISAKQQLASATKARFAHVHGCDDSIGELGRDPVFQIGRAMQHLSKAFGLAHYRPFQPPRHPRDSPRSGNRALLTRADVDHASGAGALIRLRRALLEITDMLALDDIDLPGNPA